MIIVSYLNSGNPVFSLAEEKDIDFIIGIIISDFISKEIDAELFSGTKLSVVDGRLNIEPYLVNTEIIPEDVLGTFEKTAKKYGDKAYFFDDYCCYEYNGSYKELDENSYKMFTCSECGRKFFQKDSIEGMCAECFTSKGVEMMFKEEKTKTSEEYTEYEAISEAMDTVDSFGCRIGKYFYIPDVSSKARELVSGYLKKKGIPEKYSEKILGGFAA